MHSKEPLKLSYIPAPKKLLNIVYQGLDRIYFSTFLLTYLTRSIDKLFICMKSYMIHRAINLILASVSDVTYILLKREEKVTGDTAIN